MPNITQEGTYTGRIVGIFRRELNLSNDPSAFCIVCQFETPDGFHAYYDMMWTHHKVQTGKYKGKTSADISENLLKQLGVKDGYLPNLGKMIEDGENVECTVVMKWDEYIKKDGTTGRALRCKYLNPMKADNKVTVADLEAMLAKFNREEKPVEPPVDDAIDGANKELDELANNGAEDTGEIPF